MDVDEAALLSRSDEIILDESGFVCGFDLIQAIGGQRGCILVRIDLEHAVDESHYVFAENDNEFFDTRPCGLEYTRQMQEVGSRWLNARRWRTHVPYTTAELHTKVLKVSTLTVVLARLRRATLPVCSTASVAPKPGIDFRDSACVMFFHEQSLVSVFDALDLTEQVVCTVMGTGGAQQKVYFARSGDFSRDVLEKFSAFYFETVRENLFRLWGLEVNESGHGGEIGHAAESRLMDQSAHAN